jgi:hypothetical protein
MTYVMDVSIISSALLHDSFYEAWYKDHATGDLIINNTKRQLANFWCGSDTSTILVQPAGFDERSGKCVTEKLHNN